MQYKVLVILLIFAGEGLAIFAEMVAARQFQLAQQTFFQIFARAFFIMLVGGVLLVAGYTFGFKYFQNIWIVSAVSITSILIIEPVLAYSFFHQLPTRGAWIGLILGAVGFVTTLIWK